MTAQTQQIRDVAAPGSTTTSEATGRPILVTNRVLVQDPMMTSRPAEPVVVVNMVKPRRIEPLASVPPADNIVTAEHPAKPTHPAAAKPAVEVSPDRAVTTDDQTEQLLNDKTYFLPIITQENRRSRQVVIAGTVLSILLALIWLDISLDAGFISLPGIQPLTNLFGAL